jgi:hypothetical protein
MNESDKSCTPHDSQQLLGWRKAASAAGFGPAKDYNYG